MNTLSFYRKKGIDFDSKANSNSTHTHTYIEKKKIGIN